MDDKDAFLILQQLTIYRKEHIWDYPLKKLANSLQEKANTNPVEMD